MTETTSGQLPYIYADNAATTPLSKRALDEMMPYLTTNFGNPGGIHRVAKEAACALSEARARMARQLGSAAEEIYFTSGGSESDMWAIQGATLRYRDRYGTEAPAYLITSSIEHHAVLHACRAMERFGVRTTILPVDRQGHVHPDDLRIALEAARAEARRAGCEAPGCALVSIMLANNEIGTIEDIPELARIAHEYGVPFHTDAVQAVGHIPVDVHELGIDALSLSAHKFHGPRGVGALYLKDGFSIPALIEGGGQERGERSGTENLAGIIGMAAALEECRDGLCERMGRISSLRGRLVSKLQDTVPDIYCTGDPVRRLPSIASFAIHDVDGELLVVLLDRSGVAAATGSACSTGSTEPSHVISAIGITDRRWSHGSLRLSLADDIRDEDIDTLCERVTRCIERARRISGTM